VTQWRQKWDLELLDFVRCIMEMEPSLQQMMACLLAEIQAAKADINAKTEVGQEEMKARQDKADAEAQAHHDQLKQDIKGHMEVILEGQGSCGKRTTTCQELSVVCPENAKAGLKEMKAGVITFEDSSDKMDTMDLEANAEAMEVVMEGKKLHKEKLNVDAIRSSEDRYRDRRLVVRRCQWVKRWKQDSVGSQQKLFAAKKPLIRSAIPAVHGRCP
jgi:hypothetical protein